MASAPGILAASPCPGMPPACKTVKHTRWAVGLPHAQWSCFSLPLTPVLWHWSGSFSYPHLGGAISGGVTGEPAGGLTTTRVAPSQVCVPPGREFLWVSNDGEEVSVWGTREGRFWAWKQLLISCHSPATRLCPEAVLTASSPHWASPAFPSNVHLTTFTE